MGVRTHPTLLAATNRQQAVASGSGRLGMPSPTRRESRPSPGVSHFCLLPTVKHDGTYFGAVHPHIVWHTICGSRDDGILGCVLVYALCLKLLVYSDSGSLKPLQVATQQQPGCANKMLDCILRSFYQLTNPIPELRQPTLFLRMLDHP